MAAPMIAALIEAMRMPILASSWRVPVSKASPVMNSDTVKPIPATAPTPAMCRHPAPAGSRASPRRTASQLNAGDADELADHERDGDSDEDVGRVGEGVGGELDAGVGQREDRHDDEARPRVQGVDQPVARRHRSADESGRGPDLVGSQVVAVLEQVDDLVGFERRSGVGRAGVSSPSTTPAIVAWTPDS